MHAIDSAVIIRGMLRAIDAQTKKFDPALHPHAPAGTKKGGQFVKKGTSGSPTAKTAPATKATAPKDWRSYYVKPLANGSDVDKARASLTEKLKRNKQFVEFAKKNQYGYEDAVRRQVRDMLGRWEGTSADSDGKAIAVQLVAESIFGGETAHLAKPLDAEPYRHATELEQGREIAKNNKEAITEFLKAQYVNTQAYFKKKDITHVTVFRGMHAVPASEKQKMAEGPVKVGTLKNAKLQPLSSFSTSPKTAAGFYGDNGAYLVTKIPVSKILSHPGTGFGMADEKEVVVLGGKGLESTFVISGAYKEVKAALAHGQSLYEVDDEKVLAQIEKLISGGEDPGRGELAKKSSGKAEPKQQPKANWMASASLPQEKIGKVAVAHGLQAIVPDGESDTVDFKMPKSHMLQIYPGGTWYVTSNHGDEVANGSGSQDLEKLLKGEPETGSAKATTKSPSALMDSTATSFGLKPLPISPTGWKRFKNGTHKLHMNKSGSWFLDDATGNEVAFGEGPDELYTALKKHIGSSTKPKKHWI